MTPPTDLFLPSSVYDAIDRFEHTHSRVPVSIETDNEFALRGVFHDIALFKHVHNVEMVDHRVVADMPASLVRYMGADPRITRIALR